MPPRTRRASAAAAEPAEEVLAPAKAAPTSPVRRVQVTLHAWAKAHKYDASGASRRQRFAVRAGLGEVEPPRDASQAAVDRWSRRGLGCSQPLRGDSPRPRLPNLHAQRGGGRHAGSFHRSSVCLLGVYAEPGGCARQAGSGGGAPPCRPSAPPASSALTRQRVARRCRRWSSSAHCWDCVSTCLDSACVHAAPLRAPATASSLLCASHSRLQLMLTASAIYNVIGCGLKHHTQFLRRIDHGCIYVMIAGEPSTASTLPALHSHPCASRVQGATRR